MESTSRRRHTDGALVLTSTSRPMPVPVRDILPARDLRRAWPGVAVGVAAPGDVVQATLRELPGARIAVLGRTALPVSEWLKQTGHDAAVFVPPRRKDRRGPPARRGRRRADTIVAIDWIEHEPDVREALRTLRGLLAPEGRLVVVVPNLTHASLRLAMLLGRPPITSTGATPAAHLLTVSGVERLLNDAGFTVTSIERQVDSPEALRELADGVPSAVLDLLAADRDALTSHFALVAQAEGSSAVALLHRRVRALGDDHRASARIAERLDDRVAALEVRVRHWAAETDALAAPGAPGPQAVAELDARVDQLSNAHGELIHEVARARESVELLAGQLAAVNGRIATETQRRDLALRQLGERLTERCTDIEALIRRLDQGRYSRLIRGIRAIVERDVPRDAIVAVVSRGDQALVAFTGRRGTHLPQTDAGVYAGHHPADSDAAIAQLERLRKQGARYLVVPRTAFWWFEHYRAFHDHLIRRWDCLFRDEHTCALFAWRGRTRR